MKEMTIQEMKDMAQSNLIAIDKMAKEAEQERKEAKIKSDALDARIDKIYQMYSASEKNKGDIAEEFFYKYFKRNMCLNNVEYDDIEPKLRRHKKKLNIQGEYDIVMINGTALAVIEVKNKGHLNDLVKLKEKLIPKFRLLFPEYKNYTLSAAFATFFATEEMENYAQENDIYMIERKGDTVITKNENIINHW